MIDTRKFQTIKKEVTYSIPIYTIKDTGIEEVPSQKLVIPFVKGNIDGPEYRQDGIITENLLSMLIQHLNTLNTGDLRDRNTSIAITHLEDALMRLEERKRDRKKREVYGTYKK